LKPLKADWLAWILQFIFGGVVGLMIGFIIIHRRRRYYSGGTSWWINGEDVPLFMTGAALMGGALASHFGDRLWMQESLFGDVPFPQSLSSKTISVILGLLGVGLMLLAVMRKIGWIGK